MEVIYCEQGNQEWFDVRRGKITASNFATAISKGQTRETLLYKLVGQRLSCDPVSDYQNDAMKRGSEMEPEARSAYELENDVEVDQVGFIIHDEFIGVSPDGLIGSNGLVEIKCPLAHTQVKYLDKDKLPSTYKAQVHGQMWVAEREWCDFYSYHPDLKTLALRVERDDDYIKELKTGIYKFVDDMQDLLERVSGE